MTAIPTEPVNDERGLALERLKKRRDFQGHVIAYLVINAALWGLWAATGAGYPWPAWVSGAWGVGVVLNAWDVFLRPPITEADVEREMRRLHDAH
jgi:2TM domain